MPTAPVDRRLLLQAALLSPAFAAATAGVAHADIEPEHLVVVIAQMTAKPGKAEALRETMTAFAAASRQQPGNRHYGVFEERQTAGHIFTFEVWTDQPALDAHMMSPEAKVAFPKIADLIAGPAILSTLRSLSDI